MLWKHELGASVLTTSSITEHSRRSAWHRLFLVALLLRLGYVALSPGPAYYHELDHGDPLYFGKIASHLVEGRGFLEKGARAYRPPVFPTLMAVSFAIFGDRTLPIQLLLALCGALHAVLTVLWCRRLVDERAAWWAGWLTACYPQFIRYPQTLYGEPLFLMVLALVMWRLLTAAQTGSRRQAVIAGVCCGVAALTREVALVIPLAYALWAAVDRSLPRRAASWLIFVVCCVATIAPWTIRNQIVLGAFVPISTNGGVNMYLGNNPRAKPYMDQWYTVPGVEWQHGVNEVAAHRQGMAAALRYMAEDPARTVRMGALKLFWFLRPPYYGFGEIGGLRTVMRSVWLLCYVAFLGLAARGAWAERHRWRALALPAWIMLGICASVVLTKCEIRYRLPFVAMLVCYAGLGCRREEKDDV